MRRATARRRSPRETAPAWSPAAARLRSCVNRLGLTMAAAGVDASNVEPGQRRPAPRGPRRLRPALRGRRRRRAPASTSAVAGHRHRRARLARGPDRHRGRRRRPAGARRPRRPDRRLRQRAGRHRAGRGRRARRRRRAGRRQAGPPAVHRDPRAGRPRAARRRRRPGRRRPPPRPRARTCSGSEPARRCWPRSAPATTTGRRSGRPCASRTTLAALLTELGRGGGDRDRHGEVTADRGRCRVRWAAEVAAYAHGWEVVGHQPAREFGCGRSAP